MTRQIRQTPVGQATQRLATRLIDLYSIAPKIQALDSRFDKSPDIQPRFPTLESSGFSCLLGYWSLYASLRRKFVYYSFILRGCHSVVL